VTKPGSTLTCWSWDWTILPFTFSLYLEAMWVSMFCIHQSLNNKNAPVPSDAQLYHLSSLSFNSAPSFCINQTWITLNLRGKTQWQFSFSMKCHGLGTLFPLCTLVFDLRFLNACCEPPVQCWLCKPGCDKLPVLSASVLQEHSHPSTSHDFCVIANDVW
jgi:hypothetical protein